jgi:uracil-DNA glycosylase family 4
MSQTADPQRLTRLLRQHARTSQLMGLDFLPVTGGIPLAPVAPRVVHQSASRGDVQVAPAATPAAAPPFVRPVPPPPRPSAPAPAPLISVVEPKPLVRVEYTDAERIVAQKALDDILARYEKDAPHKHFVTDHHCIVFGEGDPRARLMFIGEAPGAEEDKCGRPFVGRAGQLLDKMIEALGLKRQDVYIANVLKTRPPGNATPTLDECARCAPYLFEQIGVVRPEVIVTLGLPATRVILNSTETMGRLRGTWAEFPPPGVALPKFKPVAVMPTYHPAFLLRSYTKENRQKVWSDLLMAAKKLGLATPGRAGAVPG